MNEIDIYNKLKTIFNSHKQNINYSWIILCIWALYAIVILSYVDPKWVKAVTIFIPLIGVIFMLVINLRAEYRSANKFPQMYNDWVNEKRFVGILQERTRTRAVIDPDHIKIDNNGLKHIDDHIAAYNDDPSKLSNSIYNAILNGDLVSEIKFFNKHKRFIKDMNTYRHLIR